MLRVREDDRLAAKSHRVGIADPSRGARTRKKAMRGLRRDLTATSAHCCREPLSSLAGVPEGVIDGP